MSAAILSEVSLVLPAASLPNYHEIHFFPLNVIMYTYETIISYWRLYHIRSCYLYGSRFRLSAKFRQSSIAVGSIVMYLIDVTSLSIRNCEDVDAE